MIKKFQVFESTLRKDRTEFKFSKSKPSIRGLNKLTKWYNDKSISFIDLTKTGISIQQVSEVLSKDNDIILIKPRTFEIVKVGDYNLDHYRVYKIFGLPDNFIIKYCIIPEIDFITEKLYITLNLNKLQRGDNIQERVFIKLICKTLNSLMDTGIKTSVYNDEWEKEIFYYKERFSGNFNKMEKQHNKFFKTIGYKWDLIVLDHSDFFINKKARELFFKEEMFVKKGYRFSIDKWNPSDMWVILGDVEEYKRLVDNFETLEDLNSWLSNCIIENSGIIGVSLKLNKNIERSWMTKTNVDHQRAPFTHRYIGYTYKPSTMTISINYETTHTVSKTISQGKIEIRNYNGGKSDKISMEIKSNGHMSGKLTSILVPLFGDTDIFDLQKIIVTAQDKQMILDNIGLFKLPPHILKDFLDVLNSDIPIDYKEKSKLQGLLIVSKIENHPKGSDWIVDDMVNYGKSQSSISGPFYLLN